MDDFIAQIASTLNSIEFEEDLKQEQGQFIEVTSSYIQEAIYYLTLLLTEMLTYKTKTLWQTIENVKKIGKYSQELNRVYSKVGFSLISQIDINSIFKSVGSSLNHKNNTLLYPTENIESWDIVSLTDKNFIRDFIHKNATTQEVKSFLHPEEL